MSHPGWIMVSFLTELLSQSSKGIAQSLDNCANDTEIINALLKDSYNKVRFSHVDRAKTVFFSALYPFSSYTCSSGYVGSGSNISFRINAGFWNR